MMKLECLLLVLALFAASPARNEAIPSGWIPIKTINDPHVTDIAKFAVTEYDKRYGAELTFEKVTGGFTQVVAAGTNYRLVLVADGGGASTNNKYVAIVLEKPLQHFKILTSFTALYD